MSYGVFDYVFFGVFGVWGEFFVVDEEDEKGEEVAGGFVRGGRC